MFRCGLCNKVVKCYMPARIRDVRRQDGALVRDTTICKVCDDFPRTAEPDDYYVQEVVEDGVL